MAQKDKGKKGASEWQALLQEKKKKKEEKATQEPTPKTEKKDKKKNKEDKKDETDLKVQKKQSKQPNADRSEQPESTPANEPQPSVPAFQPLTKINTLLSPKQRQSQTYQQQLFSKYINQCVSKDDILLYIGEKERINKNHQQVYVKQLNTCSTAEFVCRFSDLSYFLEGSVTKIFIEAEVIFSNGSILAKEGALNVALAGHFYNIPVVAVGGSYLYNHWAPLSSEALEQRYGPQNLKKLDWIQSKYLRSTILQVGIISPRQVSLYPPIVYKQIDLQSCQW